MAEHRSGRKCAVPESVAEDREVAGVRTVLGGSEGAALCDGKAEEMEIIGRNLRDLDLLRRVDPGEVHGAEAISGDVLKEGGLIAPEIEAGRGASDGRSVGAGRA